jgi:heme/copper-type cytochrome/quinol oxidase subunit 3
LYGVLAAYWVFGGRAGFPVADVNGHPPGWRPVATAIALLLLSGAAVAIASVGSTSRAARVGLRYATATALLGTFGVALSAVGIVASGTAP